MRRDLLILAAAVVLLRLPFIALPVQGDDVYYLLFAENALSDPWHALQMGFSLQGETVWAAGHTRPPLNAYFLALLMSLFGPPGEVGYHAAYLLFSLSAAGSMYFLARRFGVSPLWAALTLLVVPSFVVNGNKLEADLPLLAFWLVGFTLFVHGRYWLAIPALGLAGLCAYQSVFAVPILAHWVWFNDRKNWVGWLATGAAPLALIAWQLWERAAAGSAPVEVLAGYFTTYDLLALERKAKSSLALLAHLGFVVSPLLIWPGVRRRGVVIVSLAVGFLAAVVVPEYSLAERLLLVVALASGTAVLISLTGLLLRERELDNGFLAAWVLVFFAGSVAVFYAGSARYLLPLAPALVILVFRARPPLKLIATALGLHLCLGLGLAAVEYEQACRYHEFALEVGRLAGSKPVYTNAEWGLRHYLVRAGGEPILHNQVLLDGSVYVESELNSQIAHQTDGRKAELARTEVVSAIPLTTIGRGTHSGYSSSEFGVLPFGLGSRAADRITAYTIGLPKPTVGFLRMRSSEADEQLLSGFWPPPDEAPWRWMGKQASALLLAPEGASKFRIQCFVPDEAPGRHVAVRLDGELVIDRQLDQTGGQTLEAEVAVTPGATVRLTIAIDETYSPPGDDRDLGMIVNEFGFE
jgi:hypothetical protein